MVESNHRLLLPRQACYRYTNLRLLFHLLVIYSGHLDKDFVPIIVSVGRGGGV